MGDAATLLRNVNIPDPEKFFHAVVDVMCEKASPIPTNMMVESCKSLGVNVLSKAGTQDETERVLQSQGLSNELAKAFSSVLWVRREEIRRSVADNEFRSCSTPMRDFDFKVQVALASSVLNNQSEPLMQLHLMTGRPKDGAVKDAVVEFTTDELDSFISILEQLQQKSAALTA